MRVHLGGGVPADVFSKLLLRIGDGEYPETGGKIQIPVGLASVVTTVSQLTAKIYPDIADIRRKSMDWLCERNSYPQEQGCPQ